MFSDVPNIRPDTQLQLMTKLIVLRLQDLGLTLLILK